MSYNVTKRDLYENEVLFEVNKYTSPNYMHLPYWMRVETHACFELALSAKDCASLLYNYPIELRA